jgi:hypothetical protein
LDRDVRGSTFEHLEDNTLIRRRRIHWLLDRNLSDEQLPQWNERIDEILEEICVKFKSAFIFGGMSWRELKSWIKPFVRCPVSVQRAIFLYVLNRSAGPWITCRHCRAVPATKAHLEYCALGLAAVPVGPSQLEDRLQGSIPSFELFTQIARMIIQCVGENPIADLRP